MNNPILYHEIERVFGEKPAISGEGRPGAYVLPKSVSTIWNPSEHDFALVEKWGESYRVNCPLCGDTRQRLSFSHLYGAKITIKNRKRPLFFGKTVLRCFNEECQTRRRKELNVYLDQLQALAAVPMAPSDERSEPMSVTSHQISSTNCIRYPVGSKDLCAENLPGAVFAFFERHNLDINDLKNRWLCKFVPQGATWTDEETKLVVPFYEDRLLIPIIQRRIFITWQARRFSEEKKRKYVFPDNSPAASCLYNMDSAWRYKFIAICEGVKDAWRFGGNGTALFGKTLSLEQMEIMRNLWGYEGGAIVALDPDARKDAGFMKQLLMSRKIFPGGVYILDLEKDPDEYPRDELIARCDYICPGYAESIARTEAEELVLDLIPLKVSMESEDAANPFAPDSEDKPEINPEFQVAEGVFGGEGELPVDPDVVTEDDLEIDELDEESEAGINDSKK